MEHEKDAQDREMLTTAATPGYSNESKWKKKKLAEL